MKGCKRSSFAKYPFKIGEIYKARFKGNIRHGKLGFSQEKLGFFDTADVLVFCNGKTGNFAKDPGQIGTADEKMGSDLIQAVFFTAVILEINSNIMYLLIHTCMDQIVLKVFLPTALFLRLSDLDQEKEKLNGIQTDQTVGSRCVLFIAGSCPG